MSNIFIVEDDPMWQGIHKRRLEHLLGEGSVEITDNLSEARKMIDRNYDAYILDGEFPVNKGGEPQPTGIQLAKEIQKKEGGYEKLFLLSGKPAIWADAKTQGITKIYSKGLADESAGVGDATKLMIDLRNLLGR